MAANNFPSRPFRLEDATWEIGRETWNNRSLWRSEVWIKKNSYSPSYSGSGSSFEHYIMGNKVNSGSFGYDFRNSDSMLLSRVDVWVPHDAAGFAGFHVSAHCSAAIMGYTEVHADYYPARIPKPPAAPIPFSPDQATASSLRFRFSANGDNGGGYSGWELQYSEHSAFLDGGTIVASGGTSTITGLKPGTTYYFRARGYNPYGYGAWSSAMSGKTLTAFYYIDPATNAAEPITLYAWNGSTYELVDLLIDPELDGTFVPAG